MQTYSNHASSEYFSTTSFSIFIKPCSLNTTKGDLLSIYKLKLILNTQPREQPEATETIYKINKKSQ